MANSLGDISDITSRIGSLGSVFGKPAKAKADGTPAAPGADTFQVPLSRVLETARRKVGKGRRDTILTGADGLP